MTTRVEFDDWLPADGLDAWNPIPRFRLLDGDDSLGIVILLLSRSAEELLLHQLGLAWKSGKHHEPVVRAMLRYGVHEIERRIQQGILPQEDAYNAHKVAIGSDDLPLLVELAGDKSCEYQAAEGRDLYCLAAAASDNTVRFVISGRAAAPTSRPLCNACELPDTDYICSSFSHAEVTGIGAASSSTIRRTLSGGLCQKGRPEIDERPGECKPSGNRCWERLVDRSPAHVSTTPPLQLPEAVDHLDMAWRLLFGRDQRLLRSSGMADIAALMLPCGSREDFESRISDLADLLKHLVVNNEQLPEEAQEVPKDHTLERLKRALVARVDGTEADEVEGAIRVLQAANRIRVGQQHPDAIKQTQGSFEVLGVRYPVDDWDGAWSKIRSAAADAFLRLAHVVRRVDPH